MHTHRSLAARWISLQQRLGARNFERTLCLLPTFRAWAHLQLPVPLARRQRPLYRAVLKPDLIMKLGAIIDEHEITFLSSVPSIWKLALKIARKPEKGRCVASRGVGAIDGGFVVGNPRMDAHRAGLQRLRHHRDGELGCGPRRRGLSRRRRAHWRRLGRFNQNPQRARHNSRAHSRPRMRA